MKMLNRYTGLAMLLVMLLNGCGGGGSAGIEGGIGGTGVVVSSGTVTGFGSVYVNGVRYHTNSADIVMNGQTFTDDRLLREGMVVQVKGSIDDNGLTGNATEISYEKSLEGPVTAIAAGSITVMGVLVSYDAETCVDFTGTDCTYNTGDTISTGKYVEVSGYLRADNTFYATYIEVQDTNPGNGEHSLHGSVTAVNGAQFTLNGNVTVNWNGSPSVSGDDFIEVHGTYNSSNSQFDAISVEIKNLGFSDDGNKVEVEGIAEGLCVPSGETPVPCSFTMQGYTINVTSSTEAQGDMTVEEIAAEIREGAKVEAEGSVTNGVMTAHEVKLKDEARVEARVAGITGDNPKIITFAGLSNVTASVASGIQNFDTLTIGNGVRIRGRLVNGVIQVSRLDDRGVFSDGDDFIIRGPLQSVSGTILTVLGKSVDVNNLQFRREISSGNSVPILQADFFATVQPRDIVIMKGTESGGTVSWTEVEIDK